MLKFIFKVSLGLPCIQILLFLHDAYRWLIWLFSVYIKRMERNLLSKIIWTCLVMQILKNVLKNGGEHLSSKMNANRKILAFDKRWCIFKYYRLEHTSLFLSPTRIRHTFFSTSHSKFFKRILILFQAFEIKMSKFQPSGLLLTELMFGLIMVSLLFSIFDTIRNDIITSVETENTSPKTKIFSTNRKIVLNSDDLNLSRKINNFDLSNRTAIIDNSANSHIWSHHSDFVGKTRPANQNEGVATIGNKDLFPQGIGEVKIAWSDDSGKSHEYVLQNVLYFPTSPVNVISVTALAAQLQDNEGTWIKTKWRYSVFSWEDEKYKKTIYHPNTNLPEMTLTNDHSIFTAFQKFSNEFACFRVSRSHSGNILQKSSVEQSSTLQNELIKSKESLEKIQSIFAKGDVIRYARDEHVENGTIENILFDEKLKIPTFKINFGGNRSIMTTKEFLSHTNKIDLATIPITGHQLSEFTKHLSKDDLSLLISPTPTSPLIQEFMDWHERLNHLSFLNMFRLSEHGYLPKKFLDLKRLSKRILCPSCIFGSAKRRSWRTKGKPKNIRKSSEINPGDKVSVDQMISIHPGLVPRLSGKHTRERISCATCYKDHATGYSYSHLQTSASGDETEASKNAFERHMSDFGHKVKSFHADNGRFAEKQFRESVKLAQQTISFCAVGAHHQNGIIERHIGLLTSHSRILLLHAKRHWHEMVGPLLWPFAWKAAERMYNLFQLDENGKSPMNKISGTDIRNSINEIHPFGCPVFILDSRLQSGIKAIPKWEPRSRVGIYLGHSPCHAGSVALVLNPRTMHVSPQYHLVFDDTFSTVPFMRNGENPKNWEQLVKKSSEFATDSDFSAASTWFRSEFDLDGNEIISKEIHNPRNSNIKISSENPSNLNDDDQIKNYLLLPTMPDLNELTL